MTNNDREKFLNLIRGVALNSNVDLTGEHLEFYFNALKQFTIEQIEFAAKEILLTWKASRLPPIAVFFDAIRGTGTFRRLKIKH